MDASYDGSFGSLSAGGKGPGEGDFGSLKNGGANDSGEIKIERSRDANTANNVGANAEGNAEKIELKNEPNSATGREEVYLHETATKAPAENKAADAGAGNTAAPVALVAPAEKAVAPAASAEASVAPAENAAAESAVVSATPATPVEKTPASAENAAALTASAAPAGNAPTSTPAMMGGMSNGMFGRMNSGMANGVNRNGANRNATIVSVGTGGVNLPNAEQKKPKKGLIIGVIVVLLLAAVGAFVAMNLSGRRGDQVTETKTLKEAFNSYINYVWYGKDSNEDFDMNTLNDVSPYFLEVQKSGEGKEEYLTKAGEDYETFEKYYEDDFGEGEIGGLSDYFQGFVAMPKVSEKNITEKYINDGYETVVNYIDETYAVSGDNFGIIYYDYVSSLNKGAKIILDVVVQANEKGCVSDYQIDYACFSLSDELQNSLDAAMMESSNAETLLASAAISTLSDVYGEIYVDDNGVNSND